MSTSISLKSGKGDRLFDVINYTVVTLFAVSIAYPLFFILLASVSDPFAVNRGEVWLWPVGLNFDAYAKVLNTRPIWTGYLNTILYAIGGSASAIVTTLGLAFALSRHEFHIGRFVSLALVFTMLFHGGLIPRFMLVRALGLYDTRVYVMLLHNMTTVWWIIIARTFFSQLPEEIYDSAKVDGASPTYYFWKIALPMSRALIAVIFLYSFVAQWNQYFAATVYLSDAAKRPLQVVLRDLIVATQVAMSDVDILIEQGDQESMDEAMRVAELIKYAAIIVAAVPVLIIYPFVQRYFVKGVMIGSLKG